MAIEALPYYATALEVLRRVLFAANVSVINVAAGPSSGTADLVWRDGHGAALTGMTHVAGVGEARNGTTRVLVRALDDLVTEYGAGRPVTFIKVDVEGAELGVLAGADRILTKSRPTLYLEAEAQWLARYGNTLADLWAFLERYNYEPCILAEAGPEPVTLAYYSSEDCTARNIVALPMPVDIGEL